eukprot:g33307.t1
MDHPRFVQLVEFPAKLEMLQQCELEPLSRQWSFVCTDLHLPRCGTFCCYMGQWAWALASLFLLLARHCRGILPLRIRRRLLRRVRCRFLACRLARLLGSLFSAQL